MCWIAKVNKGNKVPFDFMDEAQKKNKDGYGVSWHDGTTLHTFKTLDYEEFVDHLVTIEGNLMVIHLRKTSAGTTCADNIHPFEVRTGVMFHNGTVTNLKSYGAKCTKSDTVKLAEAILETKHDKIDDIAPLLEVIAGDYGNKFVFLNNDGTVNIINSHLGIDDENGNWYSNDYHIKEKEYIVAVYGTLKKGGSNSYYYMRGTKFVVNAESKDKLLMTNGYGFPYVLGESEEGHNIDVELYVVTESQLAKLDILEGYPTHYNREVKTFTTEAGVEMKAIIYVKTNVSVTDLAGPFIKNWKRSTNHYTNYLKYEDF